MVPPLHGVDLKALRMFCQIVECGGFTAAQIKLNASQPVMSNQIRQLEDRLELRLCERGRKGFRLTEEGKVVYRAALELFAAMDNFRMVVSRDTSELRGELRVSVLDNTVTNPESKIYEAINRLRERAPGVELSLSIANSVDLETSVVDGSRDLAIGYFHHRVPTLEYRALFQETHHLYCASHHAAAKLARAAQWDLLPQLEYVESTFIDEGIDKVKVAWKTATSSPHLEAIALLILSGKYIGFLPIHYADQWSRNGVIKAMLPERLERKVDFHLITSTTRPRRLVASALIDELLAAHSQLQAQAA